ncbi:MAG: orotate phosphoribosyltransferase [Fusobacterium sp.]|nr:orotate phosphoribosyltransferase [Fusobacterium sp.]
MLDREIINSLLEIKAVELRANKENWFTWTSGIKSPIYCDNRLIMSYPKIRKQVAEGFVKKIREMYSEVEYIVGTATAGIPHAAWVSDIMNLPMLYVRSSAKEHGKANQIEGKIEKDKKVVIIEDLISTGKSSVIAAKALREAGFEVLGVVAIFSYNLEKAKQKFAEEKILFTTLTNYDVLLKLAKEQGLIGETENSILLAWRNEL